ncbi:serine/threonine protein kinase [Streptomyces sp. Ag109_G2-6]|uniref:serine/threonine-protein kinase n=1 Tax=Streptomyces TaxID=1883 RepID=UPI0009A4CEC3|nr:MULTISPECIES: serine/threonine-protein kinase [Streptomyces]RPF43702.1 serine/threonine protein kinase [Streptomyces sp. Ag109_G2-6]
MTAGNGAGARLRAEDPLEISGYRLLARIGEGGMGTVYLSRTRGGQPVALKAVRREYGDDPGFRRRFEQEVQAARRVQGYHVVPVLDHDTTGERPWLATAFVPGLSLHEALTAHGPLPLPAVLQLVGCTARALEAIHAAGIVHRDLKPGNILLSDQGPYVIDFGIARAADATQLTASGGVVGTPQFMSPEHALGEPVGPASDIFSLGLIAALAATGRHPYGDGGALTLAAQIANTAQRPPRLDLYDDTLRPLLERCLSHDPARRITPGELAALCERATGRRLDDFTRWLPDPLAEELTARRHAALRPEPEREPQPKAEPEPTVADSAQPPPRPPHSPTFASAPTSAPSTHPPTAPDAPRRKRAGLVAAAAAVVLAAALTWAVSHSGNTHVDTPEQSEGKPPASPSPSASDDSGYTVVFRDRPLVLRSPGGANIVRVDLDVPEIVQDSPGREIMLSEVSGGRWEFYTPMGKSTGKTPQQCLQGAQADVLPSEVKAQDLPATLPVGTLMCTVTTDGQLAMLEITAITTGHGNLPDYATRLTLWQKR